ncbi:hypothetical protein LEMLEM_LOCUS24733, partial [Lemmus lemmus]
MPISACSLCQAGPAEASGYLLTKRSSVGVVTM